MSHEERLLTMSVGANGDQSANQYKFVKMGASGFELQDTAGGYCLGVLQDKPAATDRPGAIGFSGKTKVIASAAIAKGAKVQSTALGLAVTAAYSGYVMGTAMEAASAANDIIAIKLEGPARVEQGSRSESLGWPILADVDRIVTSADWADGALTVAAQPDVPRNLTITLTDANDSITGGLCTIVGVDINNRAVSEVMSIAVDGKTFTGTKIFASVTSATISGTTGTPASGTDLVTIGVGNVIGIPFDLTASSEVLHAYLGQTKLTPTIATGISTSGVNASAGTYDGAKLLQVFIKPSTNL